MIFNASGGTSLNFKVVGGTSQPTSARENTIWVNTATDITSWEFSPAEPAKPAEGMVWISTGTSSGVAFNALRKNVLMAYPLAAKQYASGQWVDVTAMSYQDGEWHSWIRYLYDNGDSCMENGGEWVAAGKNLSSAGSGSTKLDLTLGDSSMTLAQSTAANGGIAYKKQAIDLTSVSTINIKGTKPNALSLDTWTSLNVWTSLGTYITSNRAAYLNFGKASGAFDLNLDVSGLTGEHYIGLGLYSTQTLTITEVSLQ